MPLLDLGNVVGGRGPVGPVGPQGRQGEIGPQGTRGPEGTINRGEANGVASLDAATLVPRAQLPLAAISTGETSPGGDGGRGTIKITLSGSTAYIWTT